MASLDKKITKQLEAAGWEMSSSSKHEKWLCPCGAHIVIKSHTMGQGRAALNFRSILKKQGRCSVDLKLG
jgi:hypothetical protein